MIYTFENLGEIKKDSYAVIGNPIGHSLSPLVHSYLTEDNYVCINLKEDEFDEGLEKLKGILKGFNLTIPYKERIVDKLFFKSKDVNQFKSCNTVLIKDGQFYGYNTDGIGFKKSLKDNDFDYEKANVLLCGSGGVSRTLAFECVRAGCKVDILARNSAKSQEIIKDIKRFYPESRVKRVSSIGKNYNMFINGTPLGMLGKYEEKTPIPENKIDKFELIYDIIYNPQETKLLKSAKEQNKYVINGLYMLIAQAAEAQRIWQNIDTTKEDLQRIYSSVCDKLEEIS